MQVNTVVFNCCTACTEAVPKNSGLLFSFYIQLWFSTTHSVIIYRSDHNTMGVSPFFDEGGLPDLKKAHLEENIKQKDKVKEDNNKQFVLRLYKH